MKKVLSLLAFSCILLGAKAQGLFTKYDLKGFEVEVIQSNKFSYDFSTTRKVTETKEDGFLILEVEESDYAKGPRPKITIRTPRLDAIKLDDCKWSQNGQQPLNLKSKMEFSNHTVVNLVDVKATSIDMLITSGAEVDITGSVTLLTTKIDAASNINTTALNVGTFKMDIAQASKAKIGITAKTIEILAKYAVEIVLVGKADLLKVNGNLAVRLDAADLLVEKADIETNRGCQFIINAKVAEKNPEVNNVFGGGSTEPIRRKLPKNFKLPKQ